MNTPLGTPHVEGFGPGSKVVLLENLPQAGLLSGQVGDVLAAWETGVYEVEFAHPTAAEFLTVTLKASQLMPLGQGARRATGDQGR